MLQDVIDMMRGWRHSGFNVFCRPRIQPGEQEALENLDRYIIRASFSQESPPSITENPRSFTNRRRAKSKRSSVL
jgi:hypothetical protein